MTDNNFYIVDAEKNEFENLVKEISGVNSVSYLSLDENENLLPKEIEKPIVARISVEQNFEIRNILAEKIISKGWNLYNLSIETNTLEDVFKTLTTGGEQ